MSCARTSWPSIRTRTPVTIVDGIINNILEVMHNGLGVMEGGWG